MGYYELLLARKLSGGGGGGGQWTSDGIADQSQPNGDIVLTVSGVNERAFYKRPITSVYSTTVTQIDNYSFANCSGLKSVDFPNLTNSAYTGRGYLFQSCSNLESVNLPLFRSATSGYVFSGCSKLTEVLLPSYNNATGSDMFSGCTLLTTVDLGSCSRIDGNCFKNDSSFTTLILRRSTVTPLNSTNIFNGTPFASGGSGGTIYVPSNLLSSYPTATNWSTVNSYGTITWKAIEGSIYE